MEETLEEAAERFLKDGARKFKTAKQVLIGFAKWQSERMYSEEEVRDIVEQTIEKFYKHTYADKTKAEMKELWFEQNKKK